MEVKLRGRKVAILATDGVEESEIIEPQNALKDAGATTVVIGPKEGAIQMMKHDIRSGSVVVDLELRFAEASQFDAVLLPGGALNADVLRMDEFAREFIKKMDKQKKPVAFICHASWLLVSADLVKNRTLTSYFTLQDDIRNAGGRWVDEQVVRDGNWVSSRMPSDIPAFNKAMIELISESYKAQPTSHFAA